MVKDEARVSSEAINLLILKLVFSRESTEILEACMCL
jgi:hypothetical protein